MFKSKAHKTVLAGLLLAVGILLPFLTSHGIVLIPGNIFLPMHIPVILCGFICGPVYGAMLGFILPFLNSMITSMPVLYPNAIVMSGELFTYGLVSALMYRFTGYSCKLKHLYATLIVSMISGRVVYGFISAILLGFNPSMQKLSAIGALVQGIPGIVIQLILIPVIIKRVYGKTSQKCSVENEAMKMIKSGIKTCVVVKNKKIISAESAKGICHILKLKESGILKDSFVADTVIGKAAAMVFSLAKVRSCYGHSMSESALKWLNEHNIDVSYNTLTPNILNRTGDGICPMEETVMDVDDEEKAIMLLKEKVLKLKKSTYQEEFK